MFDYLWTHALISDETIDAIHKYCIFSPSTINQEYRCVKSLSVAREVSRVLNIYNIYAPLCSGGITNTPKRLSVRYARQISASPYLTSYSLLFLLLLQFNIWPSEGILLCGRCRSRTLIHAVIATFTSIWTVLKYSRSFMLMLPSSTIPGLVAGIYMLSKFVNWQE